MDSFVIEDYQESDFENLLKLWKETGLGDLNRGDNKLTIKRTLENGGKLLIMKSLPGLDIIGSSWLTVDGRRSYLHHFGILPQFQGKGLAKQLMSETIRFAKEFGLQIKLEVHSSNHKAIELYKKYGFKSLGDYDVYIIRDIEGINL